MSSALSCEITLALADAYFAHAERVSTEVAKAAHRVTATGYFLGAEVLLTEVTCPDTAFRLSCRADEITQRWLLPSGDL